MPHPHFARASSSILVVIDVQEPFAKGMPNREALAKNIITLARVAHINQVPILITEQNAARLGPTVPEIASVLKEIEVYEPLDKFAFSCCAVEDFVKRVYDLGRDTLVLTGVEAHICVAQTALDALNMGYRVQVPQDAVASHRPSDRDAGMDVLRHAGAVVTSTEMVAYQFLEKTDTPQWRESMRYLKW